MCRIAPVQWCVAVGTSVTLSRCVLQLVRTYSSVFGAPGGERDAADPRILSLVSSTASALISVAQWGLAAHAALAAAHSAPDHLADAAVAGQQPGLTIAFQGDFGVAELVPALQYLQATATTQAAELNAPQLVTASEALATGAWRSGPPSPCCTSLSLTALALPRASPSALRLSGAAFPR